MDTTDELYRELVEYQQDLLVKFNTEGRILFVNRAYCETVGKPREELVGSIFMPVTEERYSDVIATQMTRLFRPPFACIVEQWMQTPKGLRCISWSAHSIVDGNNSVVAVVASGRDITRAKLEQKAIKKKDEELMLVVESGKQMYYSHTPDHVMMYVSPRIRSLLGHRPHTRKRMWTDYLTENPLNAAGLERTIRAIANGRREPQYRLEMVGKNGNPVWVEVNEIPLVKNGKTVAIVGSMVDITEKKQLEEGLVEAEILIKEYGAGKKASEAGDQSAIPLIKEPLKYIRSIISNDLQDDDEELFFKLPKNLE